MASCPSQEEAAITLTPHVDPPEDTEPPEVDEADIPLDTWDKGRMFELREVLRILDEGVSIKFLRGYLMQSVGSIMQDATDEARADSCGCSDPACPCPDGSITAKKGRVP